MDSQSAQERATYLRAFKKILNDVFPDVPAHLPLHLCIEAAHPRSLGRPSGLILRTLLNERFNNPDEPEQVRVHFVPDRLSVPQLEGHVLVIGGPRSNVISRVVMEYDVDFEIAKPYYRRHPGALFPMEYVHIHKYDYDDRLLADMNALDRTSRAIISNYYGPLQAANAQKGPKDPAINLFSVNRHLHRRGSNNLPSLTVRRGHDPSKDREIYDHFVETILPNMFSPNWAQSALVVIHGLRSLGAFAGLYSVGQEWYLNGTEAKKHEDGFRHRLTEFKAQMPLGSLRRSFQTGWSVCRTIGSDLLAEDDPGRLFANLSKAAEVPLVPASFQGEIFAIAQHPKTDKRERFGNAPGSMERLQKFHLDIAPKGQGDGGDGGDWARSHGVRAVKIDQIDEQQILDAMSLPRDSNLRRHDIYMLGCFERKKTVYTQQTRALTLIHALFKAGKITPKTKVAIVGGGVSGMAAAIAASEVGARVVVIEQEAGLCPIQSDCRHRWLHPGFYDWPMAGCAAESTDFPVDALNWTAGSTYDVLDKLKRKFQEYRARKNTTTGDRTRFNLFVDWPVRMVLWDDLNGKHIVCSRRFEDVQGRKLESFDASMDKTQVDYVQADPSVWRNTSSELVRKIQFMGDKSNVFAPGAPEELASKAARSMPAFGFKEREPNQEEDTYKTHDVNTELGPYEIVDCDILIFATGFGREMPVEEFKKLGIPAEERLLNGEYWNTASDLMMDRAARAKYAPGGAIGAFDDDKLTSGIFTVSGAGDGALIDILRICIREFADPEWHSKFIQRMNTAIEADRAGAVWSNRREILVHADELRRLFESDRFRLTEGESERLGQIEDTMKGFDVDVFLDQFDIDLNDVVVYNVSTDPQPFWSDSSTAHRLLVWCLHKKNRVRFIRGSIVDHKMDIARNQDAIMVRRTNTGKAREFEAVGTVVRHGVGEQPAEFLKIQGLLVNESEAARSIAAVADDSRRLVSLLRLSNALHPETEKFFRHTVKHL